MRKTILLGFLLSLFVSCQKQSKKVTDTEDIRSISQRVTELNVKLNNQLSEKTIINLDHHKMAQEEGVYTPPSVATVFSDPVVNTGLIKLNPLVGLDLPFKTLCYAEPDTSEVFLAFTSAEFISKRHELQNEDLVNFKKRMSDLVSALGTAKVQEVDLNSVDPGFGIVKIKSDFDFDQTVDNLKAIVRAQDDTRWFGEVDYQNDALALDVEVPPAVLLLFGGPAPGGKAMMTTPRIGLDAFCQKLLVYEQANGEIWIAFNDIEAFSQLYYDTTTKPQQVINERLKATFTKAIKKVE